MTEAFRVFLQSSEAEELWTLIDSLNADTLKIHSYLQKHNIPSTQKQFLPEMLLLRELRIKALEKFSKASQMFFTRRGLEQSTGEAIAVYKASWIPNHSKILVLCGGIGGEVIALAGKASSITTVDNDPEMCSIALFNAFIYGLKEKVVCISSTAESFLKSNRELFDAVYIDPDRREGDSRKVKLSDYLPNIYEILPELLEIAPHVYCKVSPRIYREELDKMPHLESCEFIQENQALKECVLHFTKETETVRKIATKITPDITTHFSSDGHTYEKRITENENNMLKFLYEPDASIMRAALVEKCAHETAGIFLTEKGALLSTSSIDPVGKRWGTYFEIFHILPFHPATVKAYCKEQKLDKIVLKKRYFPLEPQEIRKSLKIREGGKDIFYCTTIGEKKVIIHCRRVLP